MKKRPFVLLEVLIALLLVMLCIVPLVLQPLTHYRAEIKSLEAIEKQRIADWTFTEIQEQLLKNEIPWKELPAYQTYAPLLPLSLVTLHIPGCAPKQVPRFVSLYCQGDKEGLNGEHYKLLYIRVYFSKEEQPEAPCYRLTVQKFDSVKNLNRA